MTVKDFRQSLVDNYLTMITVAAASVVFIAGIVWAVTIFVKKVRAS